MKETEKLVLIIILDALLFAGGILTIIIPSAIANTWYWIISAVFFSGALFFPFTCNALQCNAAQSSDLWLYEDNADANTGKSLSWLLAGIISTFAYGIALLLWRNMILPLGSMISTMVGGTAVIVSLLIFIYLVLIPKNWIAFT